MTMKPHLLALALLATGPALLFAQTPAVPQPQPPYNAQATKAKLDALYAEAQKRDSASLLELVETYKADARFTPEMLYSMSLIEQGVKGKGVPAQIKVPKAPDGLTPDQIAKAYFGAAKAFMHTRDYPTAQFFAAVARKEVPRYVCDVVEQAPLGVYGWKNSAIVKDPAKRETRFEAYNQKAAALLINDVNTVREAATAKPADTCGVSFFMLADKRGLHIYLESRDDKVDEVLAGLQNGGMLEMYLQPGKGKFYHQWMVSVYPEKADFVDWMSSHRHYRSLRNYFKYEIAPIPEGFGIYMAIPWEALYDQLPTDTSEWAFGVIPWTRSGGFTWGSGQVHELNRFGRITFKGIDRMMPAIRKQLVLAAWGKYKRESGPVKTFWNDEQRGDRVFESTVLSPFVKQLDDYGTKVGTAMDPATVDMLFKDAVPSWNEFNYAVDELRTHYLSQRLLAE